MLAHHRHEARVEIRAAVFGSLVVALDANPGHLAAAQNVRAESGSVRQHRPVLPVSTDGWNVVLRVTRTDTGGASRAPGEIDRHRPPPLRHAAPVIRIVHALVVRLLIALLALRIVCYRCAQTRQKLVARVAGGRRAVSAAASRRRSMLSCLRGRTRSTRRVALWRNFGRMRPPGAVPPGAGGQFPRLNGPAIAASLRAAG